jgi:Calcineurin-like phosphoesterase
MPIIRFIGDVHGKFRRYHRILEESPYRTHQVGDMGVGFLRYPHGDPQENPHFDLMVEKGATFNRGNHDNPAVCAKHKQCIPDGTIVGNIMYCGGAVSIDKPYRIEGFSWWPEEELSFEGLEPIIEAFKAAKPDIMVTHECPESIAERIVGSMANTRSHPVKLEERWKSRHRVAFERMLAEHKPKLWIFGHWHVPFATKFLGTDFICLPELATIDIDTDKVNAVSDVVEQRERW